ncbi:MAG: hypothetical protein QXF56_01755 [Candidatus Micrarchaeia archaeon]
MRILRPERSVFFNPEMQAALERERNRRAVEMLTSNKSEERMEAAERLLKVVKDSSVRKELELVRDIAKESRIIEKIEKEEGKIDAMPKEKAAKYASYIKDYTERKEEAAENIARFISERKMSDVELQENLKKVLA